MAENGENSDFPCFLLVSLHMHGTKKNNSEATQESAECERKEERTQRREGNRDSKRLSYQSYRQCCCRILYFRKLVLIP